MAVARARLGLLTNQTRDQKVVATMTEFIGFRGHDDDDDSRYCDIIDRAQRAIANALRDL